MEDTKTNPITDTIASNLDSDKTSVRMQDFFETTINDIDNFDAQAYAKGNGYKAPNFPIFDDKMEGLDSGLYMFAGESNHGKSGICLSLAYDYAMYEENNLFCVYFSLDDTTKDILPRIIAMTQDIPISVAAKPQRYENMIAGHHELSPIYAEMLMRRSNGIDFLKSEKFRQHFKVVDGTTIECGEQIIDYCQKVKCYLEAYNPNMKLMVVIDSLSDITFSTKTFKSDKELNDCIAKQVKKWAVEILDCPIFGSLHLRKIEQNRRPTIADVKESGRYAYEASVLFLVHNDVSRNKQAASICMRNDESDELIPVIELDWAKNKKSSFKGRTYQSFITNMSKVTECSKEVSDRFDNLIYSV